MKLLICLISLLLSGCSKHIVIIPFGFMQEQVEVSNLEGHERCDRIHIDYREKCRDDIAREQKVVDDTTEAMKGDKH